MQAERIIKEAEAEAREIIKNSRREAREYVEAAHQEFVAKAKAKTEEQKKANAGKLKELRQRGEQNLSKTVEYIIALATNQISL